MSLVSPGSRSSGLNLAGTIPTLENDLLVLFSFLGIFLYLFFALFFLRHGLPVAPADLLLTM